MSTYSDDDYEIIEYPATSNLAKIQPTSNVPATPTATSPTSVVQDAAPARTKKPSDPHFRALIREMQRTADLRNKKTPIFHTQLDLPTSLFDFYISTLPQELRAEHTCSSCRHFINHFGDLSQVNDDGSLRPLVWTQFVDGVPTPYHNTVGSMGSLFKGKVVGEEYQATHASHRTLGDHFEIDAQPFTHFCIRLPDLQLVSNPSALDTETSYTMLDRVLSDYTMDTITEAHHLLHNKLRNAASHKESMNWLKATANKFTNFSGDPAERRNLTTRYARGAWTGLLSSLRGGVIGTLLSDVHEGLTFTKIESRWNALANAEVYMRPTAAPTAGNIKQAEKTFEELGYTERDLTRYFMTTDQVPQSAILWTNRALWNNGNPTQGIFSGVKPAPSRKRHEGESILTTNAPPTVVSFRRFVKTVLPNVESMDLQLNQRENLSFYTIGAEGSKSPFAFGSETNTASYYTWLNAAPVTDGSLHAGYTPVTAILSAPHMWETLKVEDAIDYESSSSTGDGDVAKDRWIHSRLGVKFLFCLQGAKETDVEGLGLFPSFMKSEFHGSRKTVEAFSNAGKMHEPLDGKGTQQVGGLAYSQDEWDEVRLIVTLKNKIKTRYNITMFS